jgi:hypothetical protein
MMAPLIERNASLDTCCLLFVNNFYFTGAEVAARPCAAPRDDRLRVTPVRMSGASGNPNRRPCVVV